MTNYPNDDVKFDCDSLKQRIHVNKKKKEYAESLKFTREYVERCAQRFRRTHPQAPEKSVGAMLELAAVCAQSDTTRIILAGLVLIGFAGWIGTTLYGQYTETSERALAQQCLKHNFTGINGVCYDEQRRIHTLNPDGSARKGVADRKVWIDTGFRVTNPGEGN